MRTYPVLTPCKQGAVHFLAMRTPYSRRKLRASKVRYFHVTPYVLAIPFRLGYCQTTKKVSTSLLSRNLYKRKKRDGLAAIPLLSLRKKRDGLTAIPLLSLRKKRDSNPRNSYPFTAFRVRPVRPLRHFSVF